MTSGWATDRPRRRSLSFWWPTDWLTAGGLDIWSRDALRSYCTLSCVKLARDRGKNTVKCGKNPLDISNVFFSKTVSTPDASSATPQKQIEPIIIGDAVYTGYDMALHNKFPTLNWCPSISDVLKALTLLPTWRTNGFAKVALLRPV